MINDKWQIDLVEIIPFRKENEGFRYLLTALDTILKYAFTEAVKTKFAQDIAEAMKTVFKKFKSTPNNIHSDQGK